MTRKPGDYIDFFDLPEDEQCAAEDAIAIAVHKVAPLFTLFGWHWKGEHKDSLHDQLATELRVLCGKVYEQEENVALWGPLEVFYQGGDFYISLKLSQTYVGEGLPTRVVMPEGFDPTNN